jgi:hypothetical protein
LIVKKDSGYAGNKEFSCKTLVKTQSNINLMKNVIHLALISFCVLTALNSSAQQADEAIITKLENVEREAILKGDTSMLSELMSTQIVVQNPENSIVDFKKIMSRIKAGKINYSSFERKIDNISFIGNIAIVMGLETIIPQGDTPNAGKTVKRRFTNIWMKENETWKLTVRQATNISVD